MNRIIPIVVFLLFSELSIAQQKFFTVYENEERSLQPSAVIETMEGGFIVAEYENAYSGRGELVKLSAGGELVATATVNLDVPYMNYSTRIDGIYFDPLELDTYLAVGFIHDHEGMLSRPFFIRFDGNLNFSSQKVIKLPDEYTYFGNTAWLQTDDGSFLCACNFEDEYYQARCLYIMITPEGNVEKLNEDYHEVLESIGALFEFPEGGHYGHYREARIYQPTPTAVSMILDIDENLHSADISELGQIPVDTINGIVYVMHLKPMSFATARLLDDATLLVSDCVKEVEMYPNGVTHENVSALVFKTDLAGNVGEYHVIGSWNGAIDLPASRQSIDIIGGSFHQMIYSCIEAKETEYGFSTVNVTKMSENLEVIWQRSITHDNFSLAPVTVVATRDGGCMIVGKAARNNHNHLFAIKLDADGTLGTEEAVLEKRIMFHPNPAQDRLHLQYSPDVKPMQVELYDLQGRLVRTQSKDLESLSLQGLSAGTYTMRVMLEDGKVFSDKMVKE